MKDIQTVARRFLRKTKLTVDVAVVQGSGLGAWADTLKDAQRFPYPSIGLPASQVSGHKGELVVGKKCGKNVACFSGRIHYYEGHTSEECVSFVRFAKMIGAKTVILTNAAGGIAPSLCVGDIMQITDQICFVPSPLIGKGGTRYGVRFPDMTEVYDKNIFAAMRELDPTLKQGVYIQVSGPNYETPAEIKAYAMLGADAVGMSTAIEAIAARHIGLRVVGYSCITNAAAGLSDTPLSHDGVKHTAALAHSHFFTVLDKTLELL